MRKNRRWTMRLKAERFDLLSITDEGRELSAQTLRLAARTERNRARRHQKHRAIALADVEVLKNGHCFRNGRIGGIRNHA
jgi:hypothetical protein